jgi:uncharacterized protein YhaN
MKDLNRLLFAAMLIKFQIQMLGLKVWVRERAYHALTRYSYRTGLIVCDIDPTDPKFKEAVAAAVAEAKSALEDKNRELIAEVRALKRSKSEIDPKDVERLEAELDTLREQVKTADKQVRDLTKRAETAEQGLAAETAATQKLLIENGLTAELTAAGVTSPTMLKAAAALLRTGQKIEIAQDGETRVAKIGDKTLGDFVKGWAGSDEGKAFAPGNGGGGATGGTGKGTVNPWAKDTTNVTEQGRIYNQNPTLAKSLAAEAGVTLP